MSTAAEAFNQSSELLMLFPVFVDIYNVFNILMLWSIYFYYIAESTQPEAFDLQKSMPE